MYREKDVMDCLFGLAGFRQNQNPDYPTLSPSVVRSDTGLYFDHPLINVENLDQAFKNYDSYNFDAFDILTPYAIGKRVRASDGNVYESLTAGNLGNLPDATPLSWVLVPLLSQRLEQVVRNSINTVINSVFTQKKLEGVSKNIFERVQLFDGGGSLLNKEVKQSRFVGLQIVLQNQNDISVILRRIGTQFSLANPNLKLYVYHSSKETPVKIIDLALLSTNSFEWTDLQGVTGLVLNSMESQSQGGVFYIGYYEDELLGQAINKGYDFGTPPPAYGGSCCANNYAYYTAWSNHMSVTPFYIPAAYLIGILPGDVGGAKLWDLGKIQYAPTKNYGLNFDITVACDVTGFFCRERSLFTDAIIKQVTVDVLKSIAYSTRNNVIAKETRDLALYALQNKENNTLGEEKKLEMSIRALSFDFTSLNSDCLPCEDRGITWGTF